MSNDEEVTPRFQCLHLFIVYSQIVQGLERLWLNDCQGNGIELNLSECRLIDETQLI